MKRGLLTVCALCAGTVTILQAQAPAEAESVARVVEWVDEAAAGVSASGQLFAQGDASAARDRLLRVYLDRFEGIEAYYGAGGTRTTPQLVAQVSAAEAAFHALLTPELPSAAAAVKASALAAQIRGISSLARSAGVADVRTLPLSPSSDVSAELTGRAKTAEIRAVLDELSLAAETMNADRAGALAHVERAYLDGFEPLESRLPAELVQRIERTIHLELRPSLSGAASAASNERASALLAQLRGDLLQADAFLSSGSSFWFGAFNSFAIIVREGLEAVLLIAALLAYLGATHAGAKPRRQLFAGLAAGIVATFGTWVLARTILPISGGNRELVEGVTAIVAVGVLLYVSHWLFQKTYVHDWKEYLRQHAGEAVAKGSALAMAALAFAAVYREGFETVLFYQALQYDVGARAVLAGFVPGALLITSIGFGIVRYGVKLPIRRVFAVTNAMLLYLAFAFLGKGMYNLQEAGVYSPTPLSFIPDHGALRQLLGVYPVAQTVLAQVCFVALVGGTYLLYRARMQRRVVGVTASVQVSAKC